jgi:tungstate transport system substrate-binding protein
MGQTLQIADQKQAYTLSDRGTFLAFKSRVALTVLVEKDERLLNVYHIIAVNPDRFPHVNMAGAQALSAFLVEPDTQAFIKTFGQDKYGQSLFTPCANNACHLPQEEV